MSQVRLSVRPYILALLGVNLVFITAAVLNYNGHFLFWGDPFSTAGVAFNESGLPNTLSSHIYGLGMILSGLILWGLTAQYYFRRVKPSGMMRTLVTFMGGGGAIIAGFSPDDIRHSAHVLGSALLVMALWIMATTYLHDARERLSRRDYLTFQGLVQIPIFAYAGCFFSNLDAPAFILQKATILGLAIALIVATRPSQLRQNQVT